MSSDYADDIAESLAEGEVSSQFVTEYDGWITELSKRGGDVQKFVVEHLPDAGQFMMIDDQDLIHNLRKAAESAPDEIKQEVFSWYEKIKEAAGINDDPDEGPIGRDETPAQEVPGLESIDETLYGHTIRRLPNPEYVDAFIQEVERAGIEWDPKDENFRKLWRRVFGMNPVSVKSIADWLTHAKVADPDLMMKLLDLTLDQTTTKDVRGNSSVAIGRPAYRRTAQEQFDGVMWDWDTGEWINPVTGRKLTQKGSISQPPAAGVPPVVPTPAQAQGQAAQAGQTAAAQQTGPGTPWTSLILNNGNPCNVHHRNNRIIRADILGDCGLYYRLGIGPASGGRTVSVMHAHGIPGWTNWQHPRYNDKMFYSYRYSRSAVCLWRRVLSINKPNVLRISCAVTGRKIV